MFGEYGIILLDMDGVVSDFGAGLEAKYRAKHPGKLVVPEEDRTTFRLVELYPEELQPLVKEVYQTPGFFIDLPPVKGALEAIPELEKLADVYFCTSPMLENPNCFQEKADWIKKHLGKERLRKLLLTKDKTLVRGDYLIDDKPEVKGRLEPAWEHIVYDQPYNRGGS